MISTATFSDCRQYRWTLVRDWSNDGFVKPKLDTCIFIGLNPSTADEMRNDPTMRRCIDFCKRWGYGRFVMLNLFPVRLTDSKKLAKRLINVPESVLLYNFQTIRDTTRHHPDHVIAAWGDNKAIGNYDRELIEYFLPTDPKCLGVTKQGYPKHPLYLTQDSTPTVYNLRAA